MLNLIQKEQDFFQTIALCGLAPLAGERTIQALYYIFRGRKANQTVQDVHIYRLHPYYRLFPRLSKEQWEEIVARLQTEGLILLRSINGDAKKRSFLLTQKGEMALEEGKSRYKLDDWTAPFQEITILEKAGLFWLRLHLMVQTISQLLHANMSFYPVVQHKQVQAWVKEQIGAESGRAKWKEGLRAELFRLLSPFSADLQLLVVKQLSGEGQTGMTLQQLSYDLQEAPAFLQVKMNYCIVKMYQQISLQGPGAFPLLLAACQGDNGADGRLSHSAGETYRLLQQNKTVHEIARMRKLTANTVEDHLVEIALHCPEWNISLFVTEQEQREICEASEKLSTNRLRLIKDQLGDEYSYLKIRLALARKRGGTHEHTG